MRAPLYLAILVIVFASLSLRAYSLNVTLNMTNVVDIDTIVSTPTLFNYTDVVITNVSVTLGVSHAYSESVVSEINLGFYRVPLASTPIPVNESVAFVRSYRFIMQCTMPRYNRVNVTIILNGWAYIHNYTVAGNNWFIVYAVRGGGPDVTIYPRGSWSFNTTTLVVTVFNVSVEPGQARLCVPLLYTTIAGETVNTTICCTVTWSIVVAVPSYITTYTPNVTVKGYVQDMYTGQLLPGVTLRIYVDGQYYTSVTTDETGHFSVTFYFEQPGRHVVQYYWYDKLEATEYIDYVGVQGVEQAYATATQAINLIQRVIPAAPPVLALPRPSLTNTMTILVAGFVAALWAWMAREVDVSYATLIAGFILVAIGLLTRNYYLITPGAVALALAPVLRRLSG